MAKIKMEMEWDTVADAKAKQEMDAANYEEDCKAEAERDARIAAMTPEQREFELKLETIRAESRAGSKHEFWTNFVQGFRSAFSSMTSCGGFSRAEQMPFPPPMAGTVGVAVDQSPAIDFLAHKVREVSVAIDVSTMSKDWPNDAERTALLDLKSAMALCTQRIDEMFAAYAARPAEETPPEPKS